MTCDFRAGSRRAKTVSVRKRKTPTAYDEQTEPIEMVPLKEMSTTVEVDSPMDDVETEPPESTEAGWSSILFAIFKILTLGIAVFVYDIYSK